MSERREGKRKPKKALWICIVAVLLIGAAVAAYCLWPVDNVLAGSWRSDATESYYAFKQDGTFSVTDANGTQLLNGTYSLNRFGVTLRYQANGEEQRITTKYSQHEGDQLVLDNVNGSQLVLAKQ